MAVALALLDHDDGAGRQPAARRRRGQRALGQALAVGRIEEGQAEAPPRLPAAPRSVASRRKILVTPVRPNASTLRRISARASALLLDEQAEGGAARQRLEARARRCRRTGRARARRRARNPAMPCARMLNTASRTRSEVGRMPSSPGAASGRPRNWPPTILMRASPSGLRAAALALCALPLLPGAPRSSRSREAELRWPSARRPSCSHQHAALDRLDLAGLQVEQLERPERDADQPVHGQAQASPGSCAPRGSCPRAGRCVSQTLAPCALSSVASIGP